MRMIVKMQIVMKGTNCIHANALLLHEEQGKQITEISHLIIVLEMHCNIIDLFGHAPVNHI